MCSVCICGVWNRRYNSEIADIHPSDPRSGLSEARSTCAGFGGFVI
jgi:hypothetical protein